MKSFLLLFKTLNPLKTLNSLETLNSLKALTCRIIRSDEPKKIYGVAKMFVPGLHTPPFASGVGVLGKIPSSYKISLQNLYSSSDIYSESEQQKLEANPAIPAHAAILGNVKNKYDISDTEIEAVGQLVGIVDVSSSYKNSKQIDLLKEKFDLPVFHYSLNDSLLYEVAKNGILIPAKFEENIISFDTRVCSKTEIDNRIKILENEYLAWIKSEALKAKFRPPSLTSVAIHPIIAELHEAIEKEAIECNPNYRKDYEQYQESQNKSKNIINSKEEKKPSAQFKAEEYNGLEYDNPWNRNFE